MEEVDEELVLNNLSYWERAVLMCRIKDEVTWHELADRINGLETNTRYIRNLVKFFELKGFIQIRKDIRPHIIKINRVKLAEFLRGASAFDLNGTIIELTMTGYRY